MPKAVGGDVQVGVGTPECCPGTAPHLTSHLFINLLPVCVSVPIPLAGWKSLLPIPDPAAGCSSQPLTLLPFFFLGQGLTSGFFRRLSLPLVSRQGLCSRCSCSHFSSPCSSSSPW